jgi:hypothetical protein
MKNEEEEKRVYNQYRAILEQINPPARTRKKKDAEGNTILDTETNYEASDYYGTGYYEQKKDATFCFYLIYDYENRNRKTSNTIILDTLQELFQYIEIMDKFKVNKTTKTKGKIDLSNVKDYSNQPLDNNYLRNLAEKNSTKKLDIF